MVAFSICCITPLGSVHGSRALRRHQYKSALRRALNEKSGEPLSTPTHTQGSKWNVFRRGEFFGYSSFGEETLWHFTSAATLLPEPEAHTLWCCICTPDSTGKAFLRLSQWVDTSPLAHPLPSPKKLVLNHVLIVLCIQIHSVVWRVILSWMDTDALAMMMACQGRDV